jgi:hypothetical protein
VPVVLAAYPFSVVVFVGAGEDAPALMFALVLVGLLLARAAGLPDRALLPLGAGLLIVLWIAWLEPPGGPRTTSVFAHGTAGALLGWALAETVRRREPWPRWGVIAVAGVFFIGVAWELSEWAADRIFDTYLQSSAGDSALDLLANLFGAGAAVLALRWAQTRSAVRSTSKPQA